MKRWLLIAVLLAAPAPAAAQDFARAQLEKSKRHHEWLDVERDGRTVRCFVVWPERAQPAMAVVVIHENRGLNDWARSFADQLAGKGFVAIAPDLLSDFDSTHARTSDFATDDEARDAIYRLHADEVIADLLAVRARAATLAGASGRTAVAGFCWGGTQSFRLAAASPDLAAALVFYGSPPADTAACAAIRAPVYGFYGENDERINATIPETTRRMTALGKVYEPVIYPGAGHAFMRRGDDPSDQPAQRAARDAAWKRLVRILEKAAR